MVIITYILIHTLPLHSTSKYSISQWAIFLKGPEFAEVDKPHNVKPGRTTKKLGQQRKKLIEALIACKDDSYSYVTLLNQKLIDTICQELEVIDKPNS